jgi:hypothetical protein
MWIMHTTREIPRPAEVRRLFGMTKDVVFRSTRLRWSRLPTYGRVIFSGFINRWNSSFVR